MRCAPLGLVLFAAGCTLALPRSDHEREAAEPDLGLCRDGCLPTSVCEQETGQCRDCWGQGGRVEIGLDPGHVAEHVSIAMDRVDGVDGEADLFVSFLDRAPDGTWSVALSRHRLRYVRARAELVEAEVQELPTLGEFDRLGEPDVLRLALDSNGRVGLIWASDDGVAAATVRPYAGTPSAFAEETVSARDVRPIAVDAWPAVGPMLPSIPDVRVGLLGSASDGSTLVVGVVPFDAEATVDRRLDAPAEFLVLQGAIAYVGQEVGEDVRILDLQSPETPVRTFPTPGRTGPIDLVDVDGTCVLAAWPRGSRVDVAFANAEAASCANGDDFQTRRPFWPGDGVAETVLGVRLTSSRVGTLALVLSDDDPNDSAPPTARVFVVSRDGSLAALAGHGTAGVELDARDVALAASDVTAPPMSPEPSPWPIAVASFQAADGVVGDRVVVSLGRACDDGVTHD